MGNLLLCTFMTICELGKEWKDPSKIPVDEIVLIVYSYLIVRGRNYVEEWH